MHAGAVDIFDVHRRFLHKLQTKRDVHNGEKIIIWLRVHRVVQRQCVRRPVVGHVHPKATQGEIIVAELRRCCTGAVVLPVLVKGPRRPPRSHEFTRRRCDGVVRSTQPVERDAQLRIARAVLYNYIINGDAIRTRAPRVVLDVFKIH